MTSVGPCFMNWNRNDKSNISLIRLIDFIITYNNGIRGWCKTHIENLKKITTNCNNYIDDKYRQLLADFNKKRELKNIMDMLKILKKLDKINTEIRDKIYMPHDDEGKVSDGKLAQMSLLFSEIEKEDNIDEINKTLSQSMYKDGSNSYKDTIKYMYNFFDAFPLSYDNKALYKQGSLKSINTINEDEVNAFINDFLKLQSKKANGGKRISKGKSNKVAKKPVVSQKKQSVYKEIFGKQMKIYKMPDSRKEYVKYKGELHPISEYKSLMKQKAMQNPKPRNKI